MLRDTYTGELSCWRCLCSSTDENPVTIVNEEMICLSCMLEDAHETRED